MTSASGSQGNGSFQLPEDAVSYDTSHPGNAQRVNILCQLLNEDVDAKKLYEDWLTATGDDWTSRERDFVELLFYSIGWFSFTYNDFQRETVRAVITQEFQRFQRNPAMEESYLHNYDEFLKCLFDGYDISNSSGAVQFLSSVGGAVRQLMEGSYDSYRVIAVRTGMKILTFYFKMSRDSFEQSSYCTGDTQESVASNHSVNAGRAAMRQMRETMIKYFFPSAIRDVCQEVRQIVYHEMLDWSNLNPAILLRSKWHKYMIFGLADDPELDMISALRNLFRENIDEENQQQLLKNIQGSLRRHLVEFGKSSPISIEILNSAASYFDVTNILHGGFLEEIYMHVYHPDKTLAVGAAKFLFHTRMIPTTRQPSLFLVDMVIFTTESADLTAASSEELLVDSFCSIMVQFVKWEHWLELFISCKPQYTIGSAKLFINYVKKVTTNYCPTGRSKTINRLSRKDLIAAKDGFTVFLSTQYRTILDIEKIRRNPEARSLIIRSMIFFNKKISSNVALEIVSFLSQIIRSDNNPGMVASCWSAISHLKVIATLDITAKMQLGSLWDTLRSHTIQEFMDYVTVPHSQPDSKLIELKMLGLIKCGEFSNSVWDSCCAKLQSLIEHDPLSAAISVIVKVLSTIVFNQYKLIDESAQNHEGEEGDDELNLNSSALSDDGPSQNLDMLAHRFSELQKYAIFFIGKQFDLHVRVEAFSVLSSGWECFGRHMEEHPILILTSGLVDDKVESLLVEFTCEAMKWNPNEELVELGVCCEVVMRTCQQFGSNYIDIRKISELLVLITHLRTPGAHIERHGVEVMTALKLFMENFPNSGRRVARAIFKGVLCLIKDTSCENTLELSVVKKTLEWWRMFEDFEKVIRFPLVNQTLNFFFGCMVSRTGLEDYKKLGESLTCQTPWRFGVGMSLVPSVRDDENSSMDVDRAPAQDSVVNYSAFRRRAGIGHSTFQERADSIPASSPSETSNRTEP